MGCGEHIGYLKRVMGKNQCFMLISDLHCSTVIGCGGELNQSKWNAEGVYIWLPLATTF